MAHNFSVRHAELAQGGEHYDRGSEPAHGDAVLPASPEQASGIELQQLVDGFLILGAGGLLVFVVIQIRGSDQQDFFFHSFEDPGNTLAGLLQIGEPERAHGDRHESESRIENLQERQFHLEGMLLAVRERVLLEGRTLLTQFERQRRVNGHIAQGRAKRAFGQDGLVSTMRMVTDAEQQDSFRERDARKDRTRDGTGRVYCSTTALSACGFAG